MSNSKSPVKITRSGDKIAVISPYLPTFVAQARKVQGKWGNNAWHFDARDEETIRATCRRLYGTDGTDNPQVVDIRIDLVGETDQEVYGYGRLLAKRWGRDDSVKLGEGVVIVEGTFPGSAGSRNNPRLMNDPTDTVRIEIRDVPESLLSNDGTEEIVRRHEQPAPASAPEQAKAEPEENPDRPFQGLSDEELAKVLAYATKEIAARGATWDANGNVSFANAKDSAWQRAYATWIDATAETLGADAKEDDWHRAYAAWIDATAQALGDDADGWVYICDDDDHTEEWHNTRTGETRFVRRPAEWPALHTLDAEGIEASPLAGPPQEA
jgi:hypothetical protein